MTSIHTLLVPPTVITPNGSRVETDEGTERFLVNCTAAGIPAPNIIWSDPDGTQLPNNNNMRIMVEPYTEPQLITKDGLTILYHVTRTLVITNTVDSDTGNYTCTADNSVVTVDSSRVEVFVKGIDPFLYHCIDLQVFK